jgi:ubiquinol-cytochrome c reductase cytochrome b subunit
VSQAIAEAVAERVAPVKRALRQRVGGLLEKVFPGHWSFLLGEVTLISFLVLVLTGGYLAWFYEASSAMVVYDGSYEPLLGAEVPAAYASVMDITFDTPAGVVVRQTHHWAAIVFLVAMTTHVVRIFFTGAFRRPRRLNWMVGVSLLALSLANGFFGYSLPYDLLGATGTRIGHAFATSIPVVGPGVADLVFAGEFPGEGMLHRLWFLHVIVLPLAIGGLLAAHLGLVFLQTHTQFQGRRKGSSNVVGASAWPGYALKTAGLVAICGGVLLFMGATLQIAPIWLYGPFDAAQTTVPAQPDWYLGWVEGALRILPALDLEIAGREIPSPFLAGILMPLAVLGVLMFWPFIEERITGDRDDHHLLDRPRDHPVRTGFGVGAITFLVVLTAAGSHDLQALMIDAPIGRVTTFYRWMLVLLPPIAGAVAWKVCRDLVASERPR